MSPKNTVKRPARANASIDLPFDDSVGYQVRMTHRALQRYLQTKIAPYGVTLGMWYHLRALWAQDGLTQRELSRRIGLMEPTTMGAILAMEKIGLVKRVRNRADRRKINIFLTRKGRQRKAELLPLARQVVGDAVAGFSPRDTDLLLDLLKGIQRNLDARIQGVEIAED
jgi:DNA-binding MarR family transcriptional regulator